MLFPGPLAKVPHPQFAVHLHDTAIIIAPIGVRRTRRTCREYDIGPVRRRRITDQLEAQPLLVRQGTIVKGEKHLFSGAGWGCGGHDGRKRQQETGPVTASGGEPT